MEGRSITTSALGLLAVAALTLGPEVDAQQREMTTADRLAILYSPQLNFTREGEPLIHVGVVAGADSVEIGSDDMVRALPLGDGGPDLTLDGARKIKISLKGGHPGQYRHWVIVERLPYGNPAAVEKAIDRWVGRGYLPRAHEVGGLFAVGGRRIDSRAVLIGIGGQKDEKFAQELTERVEREYGVEGTSHAELVDHPTGQLILSGGGLPATLTHRDVLWIGPTRRGQSFTVKANGTERRYAGSLVLTADREGKLRVINAVPTEVLVKGVVPSEVYTSAPMEALKAQAVAARGEVLSYLGARHLADPFSICSEVHCQSYKGLSREHARTNKAVDDTRGQVMVDGEPGADLRLVDARYSSSCGGHSEHNELVWGDAPLDYLRGHADIEGGLPRKFQSGISEANVAAWLDEPPRAWCNTSEFGGGRTYRWTRTVDRATVEKNLANYAPIGAVKDIEIQARGVSGRVTQMRFIGTRGQLTLDRELAIRRAFGGLRSSMFTVAVDRDAKGLPEQFRFHGGGFGHGVGMCQTGAMMMGKAGHGFREILGHYYHGARIEQLY